MMLAATTNSLWNNSSRIKNAPTFSTRICYLCPVLWQMWAYSHLVFVALVGEVASFQALCQLQRFEMDSVYSLLNSQNHCTCSKHRVPGIEHQSRKGTRESLRLLIYLAMLLLTHWTVADSKLLSKIDIILPRKHGIRIIDRFCIGTRELDLAIGRVGRFWADWYWVFI